MFNYVGPAKPLKEVTSRTMDQGRFYKIDDRWMPSVTTVVGHQSKHGILKWQQRVGFAEAEKIRRSSAWRGTQYHNLVEKYLKNELEEDKESKGLPTYLFRSARETLNRISNIHAIEAPLFSRNLCIAGRVDCIAEFDNELAIIDFKTTKSLKKVEHLEKFFVQEAAYAYMYYELTGIEVDKLVTLSVAEDGSMQVEQRYDKNPFMDTLVDWINTYHQEIHEGN